VKFRRWIWLPSVLVLCLLAVACDSEERPADTVSPGPATAAKIAFAANPTGEETPFEGGTMPNYEIYLANADGSDLTRLTNDPGGDVGPAWSPDGSRIAFVRGSVEDIESGKTFIYVMNADGTGQTRLAEGLSPFWSPDGKSITFIAQQEQENEVWNPDIYVMSAEGADQTMLTRSDAQEFFGFSPFLGSNSTSPWSPDGKRLAFSRATFEPGEEEGQMEATLEFYVMNADGSGQRRLTDKQGIFAGWSPDDKKVLFIFSAGMAGSEEEGVQLYVIGADGSGEKLLLELPGQNPQGFPVWSPDGTRIAYTADRGGKDAIYVMNADGSGATPVTSGAGDGCDGLYGTSWSPGGQQLAFARGCWDGDAEVWVVNADGTGERHIAGTAGARPTRAALNPVWSPQ
jgi:Tol biopolymer transport system component